MSNEPKLAAVLRYFLYAAAFVPLIIFSNFISPFHFGKVIVFRSLIEIMAVLYILLIWRYPDYRPRTNLIFWSFLLFTFAFSLTTITSIQPYQSFWGTLERMGGLWTFWHYFVFFVILTAILKTKEEWFIFLEITVLVGVISAFYGFGQKTNFSFFLGSGNRARIFGTIGNAALFAGYQIINVFLALTLFFRAENTKNQKRFFAFAVLVMTIAVMMTAVRGSVLGLMVGFLVFAITYIRVLGSKKAAHILKIFIIILIILGGGLLLIRNSDFVKNSNYLNRLTDLSINSYTIQTRVWAWHAGLQGWSESVQRIVLGWGPENFNIPFSKYFNPKFFAGIGSETLFDRAHNMFIEVLVTMGLIGFISYLGIFITLFTELGKKIKERLSETIYGIGLISLVIAYIIHNSFIFDTSANFIAFFSVLGFISYLSVSNKKIEQVTVDGKRKANPGPSRTLYQAVTGILFIAVAVLIYQTNIRQSKANYTTTRAIVRGWNNDFNGAIEKYKEAVAYNVPGKYEYRNRFAQYIVEYSTGQSSLSPTLIDTVRLAISEVQKNADDYPNDYLPQLYLSRLNIILGRNDPTSPYNDEALKHSLIALKISPTFVRTHYEIAQAYLNKKDTAKAIEYFKKAAELNPDVGLSYWYWGIVEIERGNIDSGLDLVNKAFAKGYQASEQDYLRLVNIYLKRNDFKSIAALYEGLIQIKPRVAQYHASLAVAYAKIGRIDDAVNQARQAIAIDPSFENEANSFIKSLGR